jgi:hypothetical protein
MEESQGEDDVGNGGEEHRKDERTRSTMNDEGKITAFPILLGVSL